MNFRNPVPISDNRQFQRNFNEGPYKENFRGNNFVPRGQNYNQKSYPMGNYTGGRPSQNQVGVRSVTPYGEYPVQYYDGEDGNANYYEQASSESNVETFPFYPQIEGGYVPDEQYGPVT